MSAEVHPFPTDHSASNHPVIRLQPGQIHLAVDAAERELSRLGKIYQRGGVIVSIINDPATGDIRIENITAQTLLVAMSAAMAWEQYDARKSRWVRVDPPSRHVNVLYDSNSYTHLPVLSGLTHQPYLRADGSLMSDPHYDSSSCMYGVFRAEDFEIPDAPSRTQAETALGKLESLLEEFSFASPVDKSAALCAVLTAVVRPTLATAPMFHVKAHMPGSGKSYLCELFTAFATPTHGSPTGFPANEEECSKQLLAELMRSPAVIEFDNLTTDLLAYRSLCTTLTSEHISGRILGSSKTVTVTTRSLILSSGNNVGPVKDMTRRCVTINLSPQCESPAARSYQRPNLVRDVLRQRGIYVSAVFTIIRAWISAGRPVTECKPLSSYCHWSDLCRQPLLWLGRPDPVASVFASMEEDPDREILGRFLKVWYAAFGKTPTMVRDAVGQASVYNGNHDLREVLHDIADERGEINRRRLGWWIKHHAGQIVDGLRITKAQGNGSAERWSIGVVDKHDPVLSVSPVSLPPDF